MCLFDVYLTFVIPIDLFKLCLPLLRDLSVCLGYARNYLVLFYLRIRGVNTPLLL